MPPLRHPDDIHRLDFELLRHSPITRYQSRAVLTDHLEWFREHAYRVHVLDAGEWANHAAFHVAVRRDLGFPEYYGENLAAFNDCLCAIDVPDEGGVVLAFPGFGQFHQHEPEFCWHVLDIVARWSRVFLMVGKRMLALVQVDEPDWRIEPVGACSVGLNREESARHVREQLARRGISLRSNRCPDDGQPLDR